MISLVFLGMIASSTSVFPDDTFDTQLVIKDAARTVIADYDVEISIETNEIGTTPIPGRRNTKRCNYSASIAIERDARIGAAYVSRRSLSQHEVISGSISGRCGHQQKWIETLVQKRSDELRSAVDAAAYEDRALLISEASALD